MPSKSEMIAALRTQTGMSWSAAARLVTTKPGAEANEGGVGPGPLGALLASLQTTSTFTVQVGRVRAWGFASTEPGGAAAEMRAARLKPDWWAETGAAFRKITAREFRLLIAAGAADDEHEQVLRARVDTRDIGYSLACDRCDWHIRCGVLQRASACFCGRRYRVVFDQGGDPWSYVHGGRCAGCLASLLGAGETRVVNEWQTICQACAAEVDRRP